jgi:hypothetical protein
MKSWALGGYFIYQIKTLEVTWHFWKVWNKTMHWDTWPEPQVRHLLIVSYTSTPKENTPFVLNKIYNQKRE